jgi:hypothetical protein
MPGQLIIELYVLSGIVSLNIHSNFKFLRRLYFFEGFIALSLSINVQIIQDAPLLWLCLVIVRPTLVVNSKSADLLLFYIFYL